MPLRLQLWWDGASGVKLFHVEGNAGSPAYTEVTLPGGITFTRRRPCFVEFYDGYVIMTNSFEEPIVVYDDGSSIVAYRAGIAEPAAGPTVVAAGSGSLTGTVTSVYITYAYEIPGGGRKLAESNPGSNLVTTPIVVTNGALQVSGLETTSPGRPNKIYIYVGLQGFIPRRAHTQDFGSATATINLTAAALAELTALPNNGISPRLQARTIPPETRYCFSYQNRVIYAMNEDEPYRFWYSEPDEPESVDPDARFDMLKKETITGVGEYSNALLVFGRRCKYALEGWISGREGLPANMTFRRVHSEIGTVCHHSIISLNKKLFYWAEDGLRLWDGGTRWLGQKSDAIEAFKNDPARFYTGIAINDKASRCYIFMPYRGIIACRPYVYYYENSDPDLGGKESELPWGFDRRTRIDTTRASWREDDGTLIQLTGSADGYVRQENIASDRDDDGDTNEKTWVVVTKHNFMAVPGGGLNTEGKHFDRLWLFIKCQDADAPVTVNVWAGNEEAYATAFAASRSETMEDVPVPFTSGGFTYMPSSRSVWEYKPEVAGRGATFGIEVPAPPSDAVWYGYTAWWSPGAAGDRSKTRV